MFFSTIRLGVSLRYIWQKLDIFDKTEQGLQ